MGQPNKHHGKLRSGIILTSAERNERDQLEVVDIGTLSGLARRNSDGRKVLVTNLHIITGSVQVNPVGGEEVYHDRVHPDNLVGIVPARTDTNPSWSPIDPPGSTPPFASNPADAAYCLLEKDVSAEFVLHDDPVHTNRKILSGSVDPKKDEELILLGRHHGERKVTVATTGLNGWNVNGRLFDDVAALRIANDQPAFEGGESGSPILRKVGDNQYRICCIAFAFATGGRTVYAVPASVVERELKIKFGNSPPTANARASAEQVRPGSPVVLNGSGSKDPDGYPLTYRWEQLGVLESPGTPQVTIVGRKAAIASFTAPNYIGSLSFRLTVTDSEGEVDTATVNVTVKLANAGPPQTVNQKARVSLGPQGAGIAAVGPLTYTWKQIPVKGHSMPPVKLRGDKGPQPWFDAPSQAGKLKFHLTVSDKKKKVTDTDDVEITVRAAAPTPPPTPKPKPTPPPSKPTPPPPAPPPQVAPPKPTSGQWDVRHSNGKIQFKVTSLPNVTPVVSQVRALLEAGQPPNLTTLTKPIGVTLNTWVTALSSSDAKWRAGSWAAHVRFENSVGNSPYSTGKSVAVPTPPPPAPKPPPTPPPTNPVEIWGPWKNVRIVWTSYSNWVNTSQTRGSLANRERKQTRQVNRQQIQRSTSNLGNTKTRAINIAPLTQERWVSDPEPEVWGPWTDTGRTREHPVELIIEKEQKRTSNYGNTQTRWVVA